MIRSRITRRDIYSNLMNLNVGIVGLPNVGKSTLFNALLKKQQAFVANYPFATIEPNIGVVPVPDDRLQKLAEIVIDNIGAEVANENFLIHSAKKGSQSTRSENPASVHGENFISSPRLKLPPIVPATVKFVDIAGLVKGANEGAGLGNKFLSHIREVNLIAHVVRAFTDDNVIREGSVDPLSDYQTIETELMLADLNTLENSKRKTQSAKQQLKSQNETIEKIRNTLNQGKPVRNIQLTETEQEEAKQLFLLSAKPEIVVLNVSESDYNAEKIKPIVSQHISILVADRNNIVPICARIESELSELSESEQKQYLKDLGFKESGLERLIQTAYDRLGLISFLTCGEKEVRAWTIQKGTKAVDASGVIHTDFVQHFIKAEVASYEDFVQNKGWKGARENGKARLEGKDYVMQDGDVVEFKIGK